MVGVDVVNEALERARDTRQVTVETTELAGGQTHTFKISEDEPEVESVSFGDEETTLPQEALIVLVRPIVQSGSTDTDFQIYEDDDREDIDQVISITQLTVNEAPQSFQPAGNGAHFQNQNDKNQMYITIQENSGTDSQYAFRIRWLNIVT